MEYENRILNLFKNGYLTIKEVTDNKIIKENKIEIVSRGVQLWQMNLQFYNVKSKYPIYSNATVLYLHDLSNRITIRHDMIVKSSYKGSPQKEKNINI